MLTRIYKEGKEKSEGVPRVLNDPGGSGRGWEVLKEKVLETRDEQQTMAETAGFILPMNKK